MKKAQIRKTISAIMTIILLVTIVPAYNFLNVFAGDDINISLSVVGGNEIIRPLNTVMNINVNGMPENATGTISFCVNGDVVKNDYNVTEIITNPIELDLQKYVAEGHNLGETFTIKVIYSGDENYNEKTVEQVITTKKSDQSGITTRNISTNLTWGNAWIELSELVQVSGGSGSGKWVYSVPTEYNEIATINNKDEIKILKAADFSIKVKKLGDADYNDSEEKTVYFSVSKKTQTIYIDKFENEQNRVLNYGKKSISLTGDYRVYSKSGDEEAVSGYKNFDIAIEKIDNKDIASFENGEIMFNDNAIGKFKLVIKSKSVNDEFKYETAQKEYVIEVVENTLPDGLKPIIEGTKGENGWYTSNISIKAPEGYLIGKSSGLNEGFSDKILITEEGENNGLDVYFKNITTGDIFTASYSIASGLLKKNSVKPELRIEYENVDWVEKLVNELSFGFCKSTFKVKFIATNPTNSIEELVWNYKVANDVSEINLKHIEKSYYDNNKEILYDASKKEYYVEVELPLEYSDQLRGFFSFSVLNQAGLTESLVDNSRCIVYDTIKPERQVTLPNPVCAVDNKKELVKNVLSKDEDILQDMTLYYDNNINIDFDIFEANFWKQDAKISIVKYNINGEEISNNEYIGDWNLSDKNGKKDDYLVSIPLEGDGKYKIFVNYSDKSGNIMDDYESPYIVIDTVKPERNIKLSEATVVTDSSKNKVDGYDYKSEESNNRLYYDSEMTFEIEIDEVNFNGNDVIITDTIKESYKKDSDATSKKVNATWKSVNGKYIGTVKLTQEGEHYLTVNYKDYSGNVMDKCITNRIIIDKTNPTVSVKFSDKYKTKIGTKYYYDKKQTMTITVVDDNFDARTVKLKVDAHNSAGKSLDIADYKKYAATESNWTCNGNVNTLKVKILEDANFESSIECSDMVSHKSENKKNTFTVDTKAPKVLAIYYSEDINRIKVGNIFNKYYNKKITATISAKDETSGVKSFIYSYIKDKKVSSVNKSLIEKEISSSKITHVKGTNLYRTTFKITQAALSHNNQFRGSVEFEAIDVTQYSKKKKDKTKLIVDNIAPKGSVELSRPVNQVDGVSYYTGNIVAKISIEEANFNGEDVSVSVNNSTQKVSNWTKSGDDTWVGTVTISNDGDYVIGVNYTDRSKNTMTPYKSGKLTIDKKNPTIKVTGIKDKSANKQETIGATITFNDTNLSSSSNVKLVGKYYSNGVVKTQNIKLNKVSSSKENTVYKVDNIVEDGVYTLTCSAKDNAGNSINTFIVEGTKNPLNSMTFTVNRKGSVFVLGEYAEKLGEAFYVTDVNKDISIDEINADILTDYKVEVNGKELEEGSDYTVQNNSLDNSWNKYTYKINKANFKDEGRYSIVISSTDKANGKAYSDLKSTEEKFVVDRTKPIVKVTGIIKGGRYKTDRKKVTISAEDVGGEIEKLKVVVKDNDGNIISTPIDYEGKEVITALSDNGQIEFELKEGMYQTVDIICVDKANNQYVTSDEYSNVTVSSNVAVIAWSNAWIRWLSIIGIIIVAGGIVSIIVYRKKK